MAFPERRYPLIPAEVTSNPDIMGGWPCIAGTRVPAMQVVIEIRGGATDSEIFDNYPSIPVDGIEAVCEWAKVNAISLDPNATDNPFSN